MVVLTPIEAFFVVQKGGIPRVVVDKWRLIVDGFVKQPLELTYSELTSKPQVKLVEVLECWDNSPGGELIGVAEWEGVPVYRLLEEAQPRPEANAVIFHSLDGYSTNHSLAYLRKTCAMLALKMNGVELPLKHGYPVRLVAPGMYGYKWAKWVYRLEVSDVDKPGYWEKRRYPSEPYRGRRG